jgi:hypothetical protein
MKQLTLIILGLVLLIGIFSFLTFNSPESETSSLNEVETSQSTTVENKSNDMDVSLFVNQVEVDPVSVAYIQSSTLRPVFQIEITDKNSIKSFQIDDFDIINDPQLTEGKVTTDHGLQFRPAFLLKPGFHDVTVVTEGTDGEQETNFEFNLNFTEEFDTTVDNSEFFLIPDSTLKNHQQSWYTENSKLKIDPITNGHLASISFLYNFSDIDLTFSFKPLDDPLNLVFYFLDRGRSIVIGNGNLNRITLLRDGQNSVEGKSFDFNSGHEYKARVVRTGSQYDLYLSDVADEWVHVLSYTDETETGNQQDTIGFSIWPGSKGVEIDNLSFFENTP